MSWNGAGTWYGIYWNIRKPHLDLWIELMFTTKEIRSLNQSTFQLWISIEIPLSILIMTEEVNFLDCYFNYSSGAK